MVHNGTILSFCQPEVRRYDLLLTYSLNECLRHTQLQLHYVYNQIISVLTLTQVNRIYQQRVNYDLRRMLTGTEKFLDNIVTTMERDPSYLLGSVQCLPLSPSVRENITQAIVQCCRVKVSSQSPVPWRDALY